MEGGRRKEGRGRREGGGGGREGGRDQERMRERWWYVYLEEF